MTNVLVPLDGTLLAEQALPTAVSLVRRQHGHLDLVLVNEARPGGGLEGWPWVISSAKSHGDYVATQANRLSGAVGGAVGYTVAQGRAAVEICRHASEMNADLIVMASHARTGLARVLGGSVADAVVRHAGIPVLLLRPAKSGPRVNRSAPRFDRIGIALDGSDESKAALEAAIAIADRGVTELHLIQVVAPALAERARTALWSLADEVAERTGCDVVPHVSISDDPARAILRLARGFNLSLIAMGTHGRGASRLFVGSVAERVLRDGRHPMLMIHPPASTVTPAATRQEA